MAHIVTKMNAFSADSALRHNRTSFVFTLWLNRQQENYSKELLKKQALSNQDIRQITGKTAQQVRKLMAEMEKDGVILTGKGRGSKYVLNSEL